MKILIVNCHDVGGGAATAANRLHQALLEIGIESKMLVQNKTSIDNKVITPKGLTNRIYKRVKSIIDRLPLRKYKEKTPTAFTTAWAPSGEIVRVINDSDADIVHLHWIHEGMLSVESIAKINKPIVWSLHDMWAFTGGCHYDEECGKYTKGCASCPILNSKSEKDLSYKVFNRKIKSYGKIENLTVVGLSKWITESAQSSVLFKNQQVVNLPNPINSSIMKPIDKAIAKDILGISRNKKLLLFGAIGINADPRKGFRELLEALELLNSSDIELMIFGATKIDENIGKAFKCHFSGHLHDNLSLRLIYSAADVVIVPSLQENLSNIIMETMACGTPVVGFDIGGNSDMIEHRKSGYLARKLDVEDLSKGVKWVIYNENYMGLCSAAREKVIRNFDNKVVSLKYLNLYKQILNASI